MTRRVPPAHVLLQRPPNMHSFTAPPHSQRAGDRPYHHSRSTAPRARKERSTSAPARRPERERAGHSARCSLIARSSASPSPVPMAGPRPGGMSAAARLVGSVKLAVSPTQIRSGNGPINSTPYSLEACWICGPWIESSGGKPPGREAIVELADERRVDRVLERRDDLGEGGGRGPRRLRGEPSSARPRIRSRSSMANR